MAGKHYAVNIEGVEFFNGTQPSSGAVPNAISAIGAIQIDPVSCAVTGELMYNDNGTVQGPAYCLPGGNSDIVLPPTLYSDSCGYFGCGSVFRRLQHRRDRQLGFQRRWPGRVDD